MFNPFEVVPKILSNQAIKKTASRTPIVKEFIPQGKGTGYKAGLDNVKGGYNDMHNADLALQAHNNRISSMESALSKAQANNDVAGIERITNQLNKRKAKTGKYEGLVDSAATSGTDRMAGGLSDMGKGIGNYFTAKDVNKGRMMTSAVRIGGAGAAYMGAATGARYLSGGGLTYNNQGERDIAGIPFI